jgi:DNA-binding MarR family transcriptional regulator
MLGGRRLDGVAVETRTPHLVMLTSSLLFPVQKELFADLAERGHDGLRPCHDVILAHVGEDGARLSDLARLTSQSKQYVGRLVDELEALGYVRRRLDRNDRRSKLIVLTARGRELQREAEAILEAIEARYADRLGAGRYAEFRRLLEDLVS